MNISGSELVGVRKTTKQLVGHLAADNLVGLWMCATSRIVEYGFAIAYRDLEAPRTGPSTGCRSRVDPDVGFEMQCFILLHLFGHSVQWVAPSLEHKLHADCNTRRRKIASCKSCTTTNSKPLNLACNYSTTWASHTWTRGTQTSSPRIGVTSSGITAKAKSRLGTNVWPPANHWSTPRPSQREAPASPSPLRVLRNPLHESFRNCCLSFVSGHLGGAGAETIWVEGEKPTKSTMNRHPWWYDQVKKDQLSGGDWISNFADKKPGEAEYSVTAKEAGKFEFWVRANPIGDEALVSAERRPTGQPIEFEKNARRTRPTSPQTARSTCDSSRGSRSAASS